MFSKNKNSEILPLTLSIPIERKVYVGAWIGGFWDNNTKKLDVTKALNFQKDIGKQLAIVNMYSEWSYLANKDILSVLDNFSNNNWTPMISTNPYFFSGCPRGKQSLYQTIADGTCDSFLRSAADTLKMYKKPILLRFAWEMNLPDMYWSVAKENSTPSEFIASWRHMYNIFQEESATNVKWVLSFNTSSSTTIPYADLYPGDAYVDWVAIDGYNWGDTHSWSKWTNFNGVFRNSYNELTSLTDKPVMLSEVNSASSGGNKAKWLDDMLAVQIPDSFLRIAAIVFFDENKTMAEKVDWRIERSPEYLSILKKDLGKPLYKSEF